MTKEEHQEQTERNLETYHELLDERHQNKYLGWGVVVLFYAALHQVEMAVEKVCMRPSIDHKERNDRIRRRDELKPLNTAYQTLYWYSRRIRYDGETPTPADVEGLWANEYNSITRVVNNVLNN